jgi:hypothetical protein
MKAMDQTTAAARTPGYDSPSDPGAGVGRSVPGVLAVAAIASLGAGAIHATAAGVHSEHRAAVIAFVVTAIAQLAWGAWALSRPGRVVGLVGGAINGAAFGGWVQAKTTGISFVAGLDTRESVQFADAAAATLALVAIAGALATLAAGRGAADARPSSILIGVAAVTTVVLVVPGMVATGSHSHAGGHDHDAPPLAVPYLATLPVDLGGVPGVSEVEVAQAEALVTETLQTLPQFADPWAIVAMGYHSIGDSSSGYEHFVNWGLISDGRVLDPDYPESLVFQVDPTTGERTLSAAMFMANPGTTLDSVPELGGALVQWHVHDDLCYYGQPNAWRVAEVVEPGQECRPGTFRLSEISVPMVHVWIVPHPCGPFAALEGNGAGQIRPGEQRLCDHAHGAPG